MIKTRRLMTFCAERISGGGSQCVRLLLAAIVALPLWWTASAEAATVVLKNGEQLQGEVIHATRNTVMLRGSIGGVRQLSRNAIREIRITLSDGRTVSGDFAGWRGGVYEIRQDQVVVSIRDRQTIAETRYAGAPENSGDTAAGQTAAQSTMAGSEMAESGMAGDAMAGETTPEEPMDDPVQASAGEGAAPAAQDGEPMADTVVTQSAEAEVEPPSSETAADEIAETGEEAQAAEGEMATAEGQADSQATEQASLEDGVAELKGEGEPTAIAASVSEAAEVELPILSISDGQAKVGDGEIVFDLTLSKAIDVPLFVIYATFDHTATAGVDYKESGGAVTLRPGETSAELAIPLLEGLSVDQEETFEVFITTDTEAATIKSKRAIGTIKSSDG